MRNTHLRSLLPTTWVCAAAISLAGPALAQSVPEAKLIPADVPTIVIYDAEGAPGKWAFFPAPKNKATQAFIARVTPDIVGRKDVSLRRSSIGQSGNKTADCDAHSVETPLGAELTTAMVANYLTLIEASGHQSAPAAALTQAVQHLAVLGGGHILLITDGIDTCDGDPLLVAENAPKSVTIDVVALGEAHALHTLAAIPLATGGDFYLQTPPKKHAELGGDPPEAAPAGESSGGRIKLGDLPPGDLILEAGEASDSNNANLTSPLFSGPGSGATRISVNTGVDACPAFDQLSRHLLDYSRGVDTAKVAGTPLPVADPVAVSIILDASGSMAAHRGGKRKMDVALTALSKAIPSLDGKNAVVNLRAYGFDASVPKTPEASCPNTVELVPFRRDQARTIAAVAKQLSPYGYTPIADSLLAAGRDLASITARKRFVVLISDGEETCGGDPVAVAKALNSEGTDVNTFVVGYDLDAEQRLQMEAVAEAGGTEYLNAANGSELAKALRDIVTFAAEKSERIAPTCSNPVVGGKTPETATPILPGIYTVGELLEKGTYRYYRIASAEGQIGFVRGLIQSRRYVSGDDGMEEAAYALGSITVLILNPDGSKIAGRNARESDIPGSSVLTAFMDTTGNGFIIGIGDNYDRVAPSGLFQISLEDAFDARRGDADDDKTTLDHRILFAGSSETGHLGYDDIADVWRLDSTGETTVDVAFDVADMNYRIAVFDEASGKRLARTRNSAATFNASGPVRIQVISREPSLKPRFSRYIISAGTP